MVSVLDRHIQVSSNLSEGDAVCSETGYLHQPVLVQEAVAYMGVKSGGVYVDATVGEGGHAQAVLQAAMPGGRLLGIDLDPQAVGRARQRLRHLQSSSLLTQGNYVRMEELAGSMGFSQPDGVLMDLGMSSFQVGTYGRGFSIQGEGPLDMRYDPEGNTSAAHILNTYSREQLAKIFSQLGEEPRAWSIAQAVVEHRPLNTTLELADLVTKTLGGRKTRIHPATKTFQALRIFVNDELENIKKGLRAAINLLKPGGRLVVISYHSLEDRIVKNFLAQESRDCICPPAVPSCACGHSATLGLLTRKVVVPAHGEVSRNPRSRSARLRAAQRLGDS